MDNVSQLPTAAPVHEPALERPERIEILTRLCADELLDAFGLGWLSRGRHPLELLSRIPAKRLASQVATYDEIVGSSGLAAGGAWALERMARRAEVEGRENVPPEGPLLLVANHPGLADALALFATVPRRDLRVVAAERPLLKALPNTSRYLFSVAEESPGRFGVVRSAARHLFRGGAVLTFPGGKIEPDPAVLPGAVEALGRWSGSLDLFARLVPGLTIVPAAVSGVLSPTALRNPLTLVRRRARDREWLAATLQMLTPSLRDVTTRIAFGRPVHAEEGTVRETVLDEMRRLIERCEAQ
ncbi:MAG: 1-acyl-sn-glycerol-3-phosphate acyltransferase [Actinobacteria bacterium]|nr:1-acyl-sn-glycerol-3-phosphate acyltransferase [Actinomycetota bacterium]